MFHELQATDNSLSGWNSFLFLFNVVEWYHSNGLEYYFYFGWFLLILKDFIQSLRKTI